MAPWRSRRPRDFEGRYPAALGQITPDYLQTIPHCPSSGKYWTTPLGTLTLKEPADTYSASYVSSADRYAFTVVCTGHHQDEAPDTPPTFPQYNSKAGLVER